MDPISHVVFGRALIGLDHRRRLGPRAVAACAIGTLAPDMDAVFMAAGWDWYLRVHEAGTHSFLGSLLVASAIAALVHVFRRGGRYPWLMLAAWIGTLSHLAFDLLSGATIKPGWPLLQARLSIPLVAMADPWLVAICVTGAFALWLGRRTMLAASGGVLMTIGALFAIKGALMAIAVPQWTLARGPDTIVSHAVEAAWGSLTEWYVFDRTPYALRKWRVRAGGDAAALLFSVPLQAEPPMVTASRSIDTVRNFLRVHELGFAVTAPLESDRIQVFWSDIRFCRAGTDAVLARTSDGAPLACALWFGGTFDRQGRALTQIVHVGAWRQTRPAGP